jgi:hypothetical protein
MNILPRDKQVEIVAALTEGMSIRSTERLTGVHRDTIMRLGVRIGLGCARLHDYRMVALRVGRIELDEVWSFVAKKQKRVTQDDSQEKGDQYIFTALASTSKAILSYRVGKRTAITPTPSSPRFGSGSSARLKSQQTPSYGMSPPFGTPLGSASPTDKSSSRMQTRVTRRLPHVATPPAL